MLTDEQIAAIRARCEAASPGPWHTAEHWPEMVYDPTGHLMVEAAHTDHLGAERHISNAAFAAAAREDMPALLAEVERLRAALHTAETVIETSHEAEVQLCANLQRRDERESALRAFVQRYFDSGVADMYDNEALDGMLEQAHALLARSDGGATGVEAEGEVERLRAENAALREMVDDVRAILAFSVDEASAEQIDRAAHDALTRLARSDGDDATGAAEAEAEAEAEGETSEG